MNVVRVDPLEHSTADTAGVHPGLNMSTLNVFVDVAGLAHVITLFTLPFSTSEICHLGLYFIIYKRLVKYDNYTCCLCLTLRWVFSAFLVLRTSLHWEQEYPYGELRCLDSMWYRTLVDFDWKPHCWHSHLPPPRLVIIESITATWHEKGKINNNLTFGRIIQDQVLYNQVQSSSTYGQSGNQHNQLPMIIWMTSPDTRLSIDTGSQRLDWTDSYLCFRQRTASRC